MILFHPGGICFEADAEGDDEAKTASMPNVIDITCSFIT